MYITLCLLFFIVSIGFCISLYPLFVSFTLSYFIFSVPGHISTFNIVTITITLLMGIVYAFIKNNIQTRLDTEIGNLWDYAG